MFDVLLEYTDDHLDSMDYDQLKSLAEELNREKQASHMRAEMKALRDQIRKDRKPVKSVVVEA